MPSYTIYANVDDYRVAAQATTWSAVRDSSSPTADPTTNATYSNGATFDGTNYGLRQILLHFDTSAVTGTESSTALVLTASSLTGTGAPSLEAREKTWSGSAASNWTEGSSLGALTAFTGSSVAATATGAVTFPKATAAITKSATYGLVVFDERQRTNVAPTTNNFTLFHSADATGTTNDPYLSITTATGFKRSFAGLIQ